ncbi:hypothetical protein EVAR_80403_1 [Eumeta japonica]|uniref:Uncharacterized protein n=1 Tax=Eumeta variegata TaxID=151549 RepID=A0A4C1VHQ2_EUMVA|nr:hypothetical protein EVAR_80403_1 [Eumeta japonica]
MEADRRIDIDTENGAGTESDIKTVTGSGIADTSVAQVSAVLTLLENGYAHSQVAYDEFAICTSTIVKGYRKTDECTRYKGQGIKILETQQIYVEQRSEEPHFVLFRRQN